MSNLDSDCQPPAWTLTQATILEDGSGGTLSFSGGTHSASIALLGQFAASGFQVGKDAGSGTMVTYTQPDQGTGSLITPPKS